MVSNFAKTTFILMGISALIGWNAVLTSLPFFSHQYSDKVFDGFTLPIMFGNLTGAVTVPMWADKVRVKTRIVGFLTMLSLLLAFFPILALIAPNEEGKDTGIGYNISLGLVFLIGIMSSIARNSMVSLAGQEGGVLNMLYWVATGLSGLLMAVLDLFLFSILSSVNNGESYSAIGFFVFAATFSVLSIIMSLKFLRQKELKQELEHQQQQEVTLLEDDDSISPTSTNRMTEQQKDTEISYGSNISSDLEDKLVSEKDFDSLPMIKKIKIALSHARFIPFFVFLIYVLTFLVFPSLTMHDPQFKTYFLNKDKQVWGEKFLNLTYQIGDVAGKYIGGVETLQKQVPQYIGVVSRFVFLFTGLMVAQQKGSFFFNDWFPFVNMFLLAASNGTCTAALMNLGPKTGKGKTKVIGIIGFVSAMAMTTGIFSGTLFAKLLPKYEPIEWNPVK